MVTLKCERSDQNLDGCHYFLQLSIWQNQIANQNKLEFNCLTAVWKDLGCLVVGVTEIRQYSQT